MLFFLFTFTSELTYKDSFGNEFVIENSEKLPKRIDFEFLKINLNSKHFIENFARKSYGYKFTVIEVQKKRKNIYELKVQITPQIKDKKDIEETLKYSNPSFYILKTRSSNKKLEIESVKCVRVEI
jgi:tRNA U54 and U55 pseudouridine synthase Pus10